MLRHKISIEPGDVFEFLAPPSGALVVGQRQKKSIEISRASEEVSRESIEVSRESVEDNKESVEVGRESAEVIKETV